MKIQNGRTQIMCSVIIKQSLANDHHGFVVKVMPVHNIIIAKIKDVALENINTDQRHVQV